MPNQLSPDEEADISWLASGAAEAELGERSSLGPQLDRLRAGTVRCSSSPELRDYGPAAERLLRVKRRLDEAEVATPGVARVLLAYYGPRNSRVLAAFGQVGLVMALCSSLEPTALERDASLARKGNKPAAARLEKLRAEAEAEVDRARGAYAATRPQADEGARRERSAKAGARRAAEHRAAFGGRVVNGQVVFATPGARRAAGGGR